MNPSSSDELLIARLLEMPTADRTAHWEAVCTATPGLRDRFPEITRILSTRISPVAPELNLRPDQVVQALASALAPADRESVGMQIGHYKLLQKIGEGGFGTVWLAEQKEPMRRRVALKIVKVGMDTDEVIARFEAERQALALMDHPNIARVFDAGATGGGRPYFVMELVRGVAITRYCDDNRLSADARLRLFVTVCQAVQHAHQKGVIHRDLKPSNILVTLQDGVAVPKVIDFGIAKAVDRQLTDKTLITQFHAFVGTPAYTSPEQMEISTVDVDTRSDIYSLGVLLYELLAGRPPFDPEALLQAGFDAMRRTIREIDPPRPSHRLGTLSASDRSTIAELRSTDAVRLTTLLHGDVDWIVMRCLEKERARRYDTAAALALDIDRHLQNEPVAARPPSTAYRIGKFVRRHRLAVAAGVAIAVSLVGGLAASAILLFREQAAHARAAAAERAEGVLRRQAETARADEAKRASRTAIALAEQLLPQEGRKMEGLAFLVRAARTDPSNVELGPRILSALAYHDFPVPVGKPLAHPAALEDAFYTADGRSIFTLAHDGVVRRWDVDTGAPRFSVDIKGPHPKRLTQTQHRRIFRLSPDGKTIGAVVDEALRLFDAETGRPRQTPFAHGAAIACLAFSNDSRWIATGGERGTTGSTTRIWSVATGQLGAELHHAEAVSVLEFSPDSTQLFTATVHGPWRLWRVVDGAPLTAETRVSIGPNVGRFNATGTLLIVGDHGGAQVFDVATGRRIAPRLQHAGPSYNAAFSRDGRQVATTSDDGTVGLWEIPSGKPIAVLRHNGRTSFPRFNADGRYLLTHSADGAANVWNVETHRLAVESVRIGNVRVVDFAPDGNEFLTGGRDGVVRRWRVTPTGAQPFVVPPSPNRLAIGVDQQMLGAAWIVYTDRLEKVNLLTGAELAPARRFPAPIVMTSHFLKLTSDGRFLLAQLRSGGVELWDFSRSEIARYPFDGERLALGWAQFSADGTRFAVLDDNGSAVVRAVAPGVPVVARIPSAERTFVFSRDGHGLVVTSREGRVTNWTVDDSATLNRSYDAAVAVYSVRAGPDEKTMVLSCNDATIRLWDRESGQELHAPIEHPEYVRSAIFSHDGRHVVSWTPLAAHVWDVGTGRATVEPIVGGMDLAQVRYSEDDTRLVTFIRKGEARLWGAISGQLLAEPMQLGGQITNIDESATAFVSAGQLLVAVTGAGRGPVSVWALPPQPRGQPVPPWLLRLATAAAGGEIDATAKYRERAASADEFDALRRELAQQPADSLYTDWGRWILADPTTRAIAPGFSLTQAEARRFAARLAPARPASN